MLRPLGVSGQAGPLCCGQWIGLSRCCPSEQLICEVGTVCLLPLFPLSGAIPVIMRIIKSGSLTLMHILFDSDISLGVFVPSVIRG